jgi:sugar (pentulose or hexulose) kinase
VAVVLALDAGTGGAKCVAIDERGQIRGRAARRWSYRVEANAQVPMVKEYAFDPDEFWTILGDCSRAALRDIQSDEIIGVVATSQREGCVFLDAGGREIYAGPNLDSRGFMEGLEVLEKLGAERLYAITGHTAPYIFPIARYLWFRRHDPRRVARILMINDWIVFRACGAAVSEPSNATESMLFDFRQRRWSAEILELFGIDAAVLPAVGAPGLQVGEAHAAAASHLGVPAGTPVHLGGADTQCALLGVAATSPGDVAVTLGTTAPVQLVVGSPTLDPAVNLWAGCHIVPDRWVLESNAGSSGDAYEWLLDLTLDDGAADRYERAEALAAAAAPAGAFSFVGPRIFDIGKLRPDLPGALLFPFPSMQLRPDAGQLLRSLLESIAYAVRGNLEQLQTAAGLAPARLKVGGGMSRSMLLTQLIADTTGLTVERATMAESSALGCAALVCAAAGLYADASEAAAVMCELSTVAPGAAARGDADVAYHRWRSLYAALETMSI